MKRVIMVVVGLLVLIYVLAATVSLDPEERRPGLSLSGELATDQQISYPGRKQIYVQTRTWYGIPHSVTTTSWVVDGVIHVPCARCEGKRWPRNVALDDRVLLQIDGALYERRAVRITDEAEREQLLGALDRDGLPPGLAVFRMEAPGA